MVRGAHGEQSILREGERDWFLGIEDSVEWKTAVESKKPRLMAVTQSGDGSLRARSLCHTNTSFSVRREEGVGHAAVDEVQVVKIDPQVVEAFWASLQLELIYMTNDDDERYSIQAHPTLLRNIFVQAADPPLGYPLTTKTTTDKIPLLGAPQAGVQ